MAPRAEVVVRRPHEGLRRYVDRYVGYRLEGFPPGLHRGLPSRGLTFLIRLDEPRAFVAGLRTSATLLAHDGHHFGVAVELTVRGARALFATPAGALTNAVADLDDLLRPTHRGLAERMLERRSWNERFALLDQALLRNLRFGREPPTEVSLAWDLFTADDASTSVEAVARCVGWGRRHFTEVFGREVGLPPRQLLRILRFERSRQLVRHSPRMSMTEVASTAGYFDHPHLLREWHRLAGCRPEQWLREELLSVQAEADGKTVD